MMFRQRKPVIGETRYNLPLLKTALPDQRIIVITGMRRVGKTTTLNEYLEFLEKTYVIYRLPAYACPDKAVVLGKKLYFRDNGIANILAHPGEGALFENAVFNQLREYGEPAYLSKRSEYEVDFVVTPPNQQPVGLEVKYHPIATDDQKLKRIAQKNGLSQSWVVGRYATPGFEDFLWGGSIF